MKTSKEQVAKNREIILKKASEMFRQHGFEAVSVAEIMKACGLTHGGFYGYFSSKDDLIAKTCAMWAQKRAETLYDELSDSPQINRAKYINSYLTPEKRDNPDIACLFPSLCGELSHQSDAVKAEFTPQLKKYLAGLNETTGGDMDDTLLVISALVGVMSLARSVNDAALSETIMNSVKATLNKTCK